MKRFEKCAAPFCGRAKLMLCVALSTQAMAQGTSSLEEIVVTAQHREESLQDTQISISALSATDIAEMGVSNTKDLGHFAPNVTMTPYQGGKSGIGVNMRGIGQNETIVSFDPAVGVYVDDVLISKNVGALTDVLDLERIEILRGPQGTLYGRNTMGGTLNYITKKPVDILEGHLTATLGKYGQRDLKGALNLPLLGPDSSLGALNLRVSAATINRDGLIDNVLPGAPESELETKDRDVAMLHLGWEPSDDLSILYSYDRTRIDEEPGTPWLTGFNPDSTFGVLLSPYVIGYRTDRPDSIAVNSPHMAFTEVDGHALHVEYALSDTLTFKSITASREMLNRTQADSDGSPLLAIETSDVNDLEQFTQEFRLVGTALDDRLDFTAGVFYIKEEADIENGVQIFATRAFTMAQMENESWALYGQATYHLSDKWNLTAGIRYTEEEKELAKQEYNLGWVPGNNVLDYELGQDDFSNVSPMASIGYAWNENVMTYFKVSTGYQSGGFNIRDANTETFPRGYDEEDLLAYELGFKSDISDNIRLNAAIWFSDYSDKRINNFNPETLGNIVTNAEKVEIYGAELELLAQLNDYFRLGVNYGFTKPEFKNYERPGDVPGEVVDFSHVTNFPYAPENTANINISYEYPMDLGVLKARIDWSYKDEYNFLAPQPERNYQGSYDLWNARLTLDEMAGPNDTSVRVSFWGRNLTDESYYINGVNIYRTFGFDENMYAEPRTYGVDVQLSF